MAIMITNLQVAQGTPIGTLIGTLHVYNSGVTVPSSFMLTSAADGLFALNSAGTGLVTAAAILPVGFYAVKIRALGTATPGVVVGRFVIQVTTPPAPGVVT
jgi:hypothetical protein